MDKRQLQRRPSGESGLVIVVRRQDTQAIDHRQERFDSLGSKSGDLVFGAFYGRAAFDLSPVDTL